MGILTFVKPVPQEIKCSKPIRATVAVNMKLNHLKDFCIITHFYIVPAREASMCKQFIVDFVFAFEFFIEIKDLLFTWSSPPCSVRTSSILLVASLSKCQHSG